MALTVNNQATLRLFRNLFGKNTGASGNLASGNFTWSFNSLADSFTSRSSTQIIQLTVQKMQTAINASASGVTLGSVSGAVLQRNTFTLSGGAIHADQEAPAPSQWEIERAIEKAGGSEALSPWLVDGKTKVDINGGKVVVDVAATSAAENETTAAAGADAKTRAAQSIARFGFDASALDGDLATLRDNLRQEGLAQKSMGDPRLSLAIEYALEDAFAKLSAYENAATGGAAAGTRDAYQTQRETNRKQADSIVSQLNLGNGSTWGLQSMAEDLAVFGLDMTALAGDLGKLADSVRAKSQTMLADLEKRYAGTEAEFIQERNRITGASARLANGLEGARYTSLASAGLEVSANVQVTVGGARLDASTVIAVGNVIVDPLVLDLAGDGIDLSSADDGVLFDMSGDGVQNQTGFIRGDDALLFMDTHGDGVVHDGRQLFGNTQGHANGFDMLAQYDDNGDGVIDENDAIYDQLRVWVEKTEDGVCDADETMSLREAGVASINLGYQNVREDDGKGNLIGQTGSFARDDGSAGYVADVWLQEKKA